MKVKTGLVMELDETVIEMINKEIYDIIDPSEVLRVFQVVPKLVEVERVIERVVEHFVEVPKIRDVVVTKEVPVPVNRVETV